MLPTSLDEPAIQDAFKAIILKLVLGITGSAGLFLDDKTTAAVSVIIAAAVAAVLSYVQGRATRSKVFAPATVEQLAPGATGDPVLEVPINR